jgi:hypothetical protein
MVQKRAPQGAISVHDPKQSTGCSGGRESKAGAGPRPAGLGARQGRAAKCATAHLERLTESAGTTALPGRVTNSGAML